MRPWIVPTGPASLDGGSNLFSDASRGHSVNEIQEIPQSLLRSDNRFRTLFTATHIQLLSVQSIADLQQAISDLQAQLANKYSDEPEILQEMLVQEIMEYLQAELDSTTNLKSDNHHPVFGTTGVYYKRCLRTLRQLSVTYKLFPSSLVIQNVKQDGRYAVGGGGFADIYRGTMREQRVCLKVL
ncbi:hypothetical protein BT96DRAFT_1036884 [Gymnopus androsaceus JB14]|uniref:Protein kinase domain-containing protein n=1 Tax=Gymnopus androsaceus JB14 TaxID=1447944 RepID=A0A6A4HHV3_9AGAR|nr:hypothetical protein BT96DRAFT_1036884 [Gymnopus androsaceus JB14]